MGNMKTGCGGRTGLIKCIAGVTAFSFLGLGSAANVGAFTRLQAHDLNRRVASLIKIADSPDGNLLTVAQEMHSVTRSNFGPAPMEFSETLMMQFAGSFGTGEDYASFDILSVKDVGYGNMLEGGVPLVTFQKDWNPGIFANFGYDYKDGINLKGLQFAEMMGTVPAAISSYVIGGVLLAAAGVTIVAASSGGSSDDSPPQSQPTQSSPGQPGVTPGSPASDPQPGTLQTQTSSEPPSQDQGQTSPEPAGDPDCDEEKDKKDKKDKSNNRDGDKNQPEGTAVGFKHNK